jgi:16S rRNA (cytosine967-C5)-methyltransferase
VLDACAAPGGKTGHIAELQPALADLLAVDVDAARLALVDDNLRRLARAGRTRQADLADPAALADELPFDRILLDAPCSSTGVIRRHPDIKLLRRASDIEALARQQARLLRQLFTRLAPGGLLLYATCSVLPAENEAVVAAFLAAEPRARAEPWPATLPLPPGAVALPCGTQLLPGGAADTDGFYYALIRHGRSPA